MNIKELAQQAGLCYTLGNYEDWIDAGPAGMELEKFAELVAAHEREQCAKLFESVQQDATVPVVYFSLSDTAKAIRARGQQ
jgi:hypothetical protein